MNYLAQSIAVLGLMEERGELPSSQPTALVNVPLFHVTGEVPLLLQTYAMGRKLVMMPKWDAETAMRPDRTGKGHVLRRRAADELRDRDPPRPRQLRPFELRHLSPAAARRARSSTSPGSRRRCRTPSRSSATA
jgi:hypothetical protein